MPQRYGKIQRDRPDSRSVPSPVFTQSCTQFQGSDSINRPASARFGHRFPDIAIAARSGETATDKAGPLQRKDAGAGPAQPKTPVPTGAGQALPSPVRDKMEASFGHSFADVRVHSGEEAKQVGALAYTRGTDIHFQPGLYDPFSRSGQELLGHELTHVVQQRAGRVSQPQPKAAGAAPINADASLEAEAEALGVRAARGETATVSGAGGGLQRKPEDAAPTGQPIQCAPGGLGTQLIEGVKSTAPLVDLLGSGLGEYSGMGNVMGGLGGMVGGSNDTLEGVSNVQESGFSNRLNGVSNMVGGLSGLGDAVPKALNLPGAVGNATGKVGSFLSPYMPSFLSSGLSYLGEGIGSGVTSLYNGAMSLPGMSTLGSGLGSLGEGVTSLYNKLPEQKDVPGLSMLPGLSDIMGWLPTISSGMKIVSGMTEAWNKSPSKNQALALTKTMGGKPFAGDAARILHDEAWYSVLWSYGKSTAGVAELGAELFTAGTAKYGITVASKLYDSGLLGMASNNIGFLRQAVEYVVGTADKGKEARESELKLLVPDLARSSKIDDIVSLCKMADSLGMTGFTEAVTAEFNKDPTSDRAKAFARKNI